MTTIALGGQVARDLESLAHETNGRIYAASSGEFGIDSELQEAFLSEQDFLYGRLFLFAWVGYTHYQKNLCLKMHSTITQRRGFCIKSADNKILF